MVNEVRPIRPTSYLDSSGNTVNLPASKTGVNMTTAQEIVAAPVSGQRLLITGVTFINADNDEHSFVLQQGGTDLFPDMVVRGYTTLHITFPQAIPLSEAEGCDVKCTDNDVTQGVIIYGYPDYC